jgi:ABC-type Mn2+/Zn2+ transport system ATPase subunit
MPSKSKPSPRVVIFAGPNGAGKSTHADAILAALGTETTTWRQLQKLSKTV